MKFEELKIKGAFLIQAKPFIDERGSFRRHFCEQEFKNKGLDNNVSQANISENNYRHTLRGFHYLSKPYSEAKTLSCISGSIYDIIVDLRSNSESFLQWIGLTLIAKEQKSIHIPSGCANAFLTLENNSLIHYYFSKPYIKEADTGFRYNDPLFDFDWPFEPVHISTRDKNLPNLIIPEVE